MSKNKMMLLATTLILSSGLAGCFGEETTTYDRTELRVQCEKESGFSGESMLVPETRTVFVWRADGKEVAECADGKLVGILGHNHPAD
jgi:adenosylmethionine-8-amino-7-oxononanoate aminotransferase